MVYTTRCMTLSYEEKLLQDWEDIFRQGLLTFWVFVSLYDQKLTVTQISERVQNLTNNTYSPADQTLYRLLRRHYDLETVNFKEIPGSSGPYKKLYYLSGLGKNLLKDFIDRNITLFSNKDINKIVKETS